MRAARGERIYTLIIVNVGNAGPSGAVNVTELIESPSVGKSSIRFPVAVPSSFNTSSIFTRLCYNSFLGLGIEVIAGRCLSQRANLIDKKRQHSFLPEQFV